jgi:hypothetical protein
LDVSVARGCDPGDRERFVHDAPNGAGAAPALSAATQAMVNLTGRARNVLARRQRRTHVVVGENVAGAHDHFAIASSIAQMTALAKMFCATFMRPPPVRRA